MKTKFLLLGLVIGSFACKDSPDSYDAKTTEAKDVDQAVTGDKWDVNATASKIEWIGTKVTGYHTGMVPVKDGEVYVNDGEITGGKFVLDIANLTVSGPKDADAASNNKLLGHLKSADFFDVSKHPEGTFELTKVQPYKGDVVKDTTDVRQEEINEYKVTNPTHLISGNLTLKGVTKNIEFPARITVSGNTADAVAKFNIDRKKWGIVYPGKPDDLIRDEIHLGISIKAEN